MKNIILKTVLVAVFATTALGTIAKEKEVLNTKPIVTQSIEEQLMEEVLKNESDEDAFIASFDTDARIFIYDAKGTLVLEAKLRDPQIRKVKRMVTKSDLIAEIDGSFYYLINE